MSGLLVNMDAASIETLSSEFTEDNKEGKNNPGNFEEKKNGFYFPLLPTC